MTISFAEAFEKRDVVSNREVYEFEAIFIVSTDTPGEIVDEGTVRNFAITSMPLVIDNVPFPDVFQFCLCFGRVPVPHQLPTRQVIVHLVNATYF